MGAHDEPGSDRLAAGRYRLEEVLGRGGMGVVWRATDTLLERTVAVKELRAPIGASESERTAFMDRAMREARHAGRLNHPGVVGVHDVISSTAGDEDTVYIVMEHVAAPSLADLLDEHGALPAPRAAAIGLGVLDALDAAHAMGIVHRDIKPGNVLVAPGDRVKLTDFGIALAAEDSRLTRTGVVGTQGYLAPECFETGRAGPAADLWALGATLYHTVAGHAPFERDTSTATMRAIVFDDIPTLPGDPRLAQVVGGLLTRPIEQRIDSDHARELLRPVASSAGAAGGTGEPTGGHEPWESNATGLHHFPGGPLPAPMPYSTGDPSGAHPLTPGPPAAFQTGAPGGQHPLTPGGPSGYPTGGSTGGHPQTPYPTGQHPQTPYPASGPAGPTSPGGPVQGPPPAAPPQGPPMPGPPPPDVAPQHPGPGGPQGLRQGPPQGPPHLGPPPGPGGPGGPGGPWGGPPPRRSRLPWVLGGAVVVIAVVLILVFTVFTGGDDKKKNANGSGGTGSAGASDSGGSSGGDPRATAEAFLRAAKSGDAEGVKAQLCKQDRDSELADTIGKTHVESYTIHDISQSGDKATVHASVKADGHTSDDAQLPEVREDGAWKVCISSELPSGLPSASEPPSDDSTSSSEALPPAPEPSTSSVASGSCDHGSAFEVVNDYATTADFEGASAAEACVYPGTVPASTTAQVHTYHLSSYKDGGDPGPYVFTNSGHTKTATIRVTKKPDGKWWVTAVTVS